MKLNPNKLNMDEKITSMDDEDDMDDDQITKTLTGFLER